MLAVLFVFLKYFLFSPLVFHCISMKKYASCSVHHDYFFHLSIPLYQYEKDNMAQLWSALLFFSPNTHISFPPVFLHGSFSLLIPISSVYWNISKVGNPFLSVKMKERTLIYPLMFQLMTESFCSCYII